LRILLSEGSSTSAREAVTLLGLAGHHVEICDPDPHCIARFSRFVRRFHRCPGLGVDPQGYVVFVAELVATRRFDVLLPIHEQGLALARVSDALTAHVAVALPSFAAYAQAVSKTSFSRLLSGLGLPQPRTRLVGTPEQALAEDAFPLVLKRAIGTASRGVWIVRNRDELRAAVVQLCEDQAFDDPVLVQDYIDAPVEHAQAVFSQGRMLGMHAYRQVARGAGGGDAIKESVHRPDVGEHLAVIGRHLAWHGALSVDYLAPETPNGVLYIDCNPRLVEPVNAMLAGHDLLDLLLRVTTGPEPSPLSPGRRGVRSHLALQALLGCALRTRSRSALLRECWRLAAGTGPYRGSQEELTPLRWDWPSVAPTLVLAHWLLIHPGSAATMAGRWGDHLLNAESVRVVREWVGIRSGVAYLA
jgi:predicted ATP-grasp superfamily ATP-dependent carboligase